MFPGNNINNNMYNNYMYNNNMQNNNMCNNNMMNNNNPNNYMMNNNNNMMNNYMNNIMNNANIMSQFNNLGNMNNMNIFNPNNINPMTFQLMLNFMLMMNPNININDPNNVMIMMMNFMNANPFVYQLFMNSQQNNFNNTNANLGIIRENSGNIKNEVKKGGILPRPDKNNSNFNQGIDPFFGNPNPRSAIIFISGTGIKTQISAPKNISVHELFVAFIHKMGLHESVLGKFIYFCFNGKKIPTNEQTNITDYGLMDATVIMVLDTSNLLGGINLSIKSI